MKLIEEKSILIKRIDLKAHYIRRMKLDLEDVLVDENVENFDVAYDSERAEMNIVAAATVFY